MGVQAQLRGRSQESESLVARHVQREPAERRANGPVVALQFERYSQGLEGDDLIGQGPEPVVLKLDQLGLPEPVVLHEGLAGVL